MVCGVSLRSRKLEQSWERLTRIRAELDDLRNELVELARMDAEAYDALVSASREARSKDDEHSTRKLEAALLVATDTPSRTVAKCISVLRKAQEVAELGSRSARSDVEVAVFLGEAGAKGAGANVMINLESDKDPRRAETMKARTESQLRSAAELAKKALETLRPG
jgi:formiminotetrahydrofolate cyclodeaminase